MMEKMTAYCGIICTKCPAFLATQNDDDDERSRVAKMWSQSFEADLRPEDINCDGCLAESDRLFSYCQVCAVRACGRKKAVLNCAYCQDYGCEKLTKIFDMVPEAKQSLEEIRRNL